VLRQPGTQFGNLRLQRRHLRLQRQDRNAYGRRENLACGLQLGYYGHDRSPAAFPAPAYPTERLRFKFAPILTNAFGLEVQALTISHELNDQIVVKRRLTTWHR
jgi:hypothetical protein